MKVSEERELLNSHKIFNDWGLVGKNGWIVWYLPLSDETMAATSGWRITGIGRDLHGGKQISWYDRRDTKRFSTLTYRIADKAKVLGEATIMSGISDWRRSPLGGNSYVSATRVKAVIESLAPKQEVAP